MNNAKIKIVWIDDSIYDLIDLSKRKKISDFSVEKRLNEFKSGTNIENIDIFNLLKKVTDANNSTYIKDLKLQMGFNHQNPKDEDIVKKLRDQGYIIYCFQDFYNAILFLKENTEIDIVLLDPISRFKLDLDVLSLVREANPFTQLIVVTNKTRKKLLEASPALGISTVLIKPIHYDTLNPILINLTKLISKEKFTFNVKIPHALRTIYQQYLLYFKDFVNISKNKNIEFLIIQTQEGLEISTELNEGFTEKELKDTLLEYVNLTKQDVDKLDFIVHENTNTKDFNLLMLSLKNQINNLNSNLEIARLRSEFLLEENTFYKKLLTNFSMNTNNTKISNDSFDYFIELIKRGKLKRAVDELDKEIKQNFKEKYSEFVLFSSRLYKVLLDSRSGVISKQEELRELSKLSSGLIDFIDELNKTL